jgi:predicted ATPase/DNA-binding XRE family transcriptional regulator
MLARDAGRVTEPALSFAGLLRQLRAEAKLTQEELAEAAGLSPRSVSDLERGVNRTARKDTALLLAAALDLSEPVGQLFVAVARGRRPATEVLAAQAVLRQEVRAPPARARHNLPAPLTSFIGRERELGELTALIGRARLVTLSGLGGVGKTRLALELAIMVLPRFTDGVWLAELAGISEPGLVPSLLMEALGVRQAGDVPALEALRYRLERAQLLLVLDNCEHLLDACGQVANVLLRRAPGLRILATSREPLGVRGEVAYPVPPLAVPSDGAAADAEAQSSAVRLFADRASAARGGGAGLAAPVAVAARICRKLDGLPLAIELAAARMGSLSASEIEAHLADRFRFLANRRPGGEPRHQALQAAMDWSYELLPPDDRNFLAELSIFAGSFGLAQVAEVCADQDQAAALESIERLVAKSLVSAEPAEEGTRYRLLETVRQYAAARLGNPTEPEAEAARRRHAEAYLGLADREHDTAVLARDHDNFRAALEWSLSGGDDTGPSLAAALGEFWITRGLLKEARDWLQRALAQALIDPRLRTDLHRLLGAVLNELGEFNAAEAALREGSHIAAAAGLGALQARIQVLLAYVHLLQTGEHRAALAPCQAAIQVLETDNDAEGLAEAWLLLGQLRLWLAEPPADQEALERALAYARRSGNQRVQALAATWLIGCLTWLPVPADDGIARAEQLLHAVSDDPVAEAQMLSAASLLYGYAGRHAEAKDASARSLATLTRAGAKQPWSICAVIGGQMELAAGNPAAAEHLLSKVHDVLLSMGDQGWIGFATSLLADAHYEQGHFDQAQRLVEEPPVADDPVEQAWWRVIRAKLTARRGDIPAAHTLLDEAEALLPLSCWTVPKAEFLMARAEVHRLAGKPGHAATCLRQALRSSENRRAEGLARQARSRLERLTAEPEQGRST